MNHTEALERQHSSVISQNDKERLLGKLQALRYERETRQRVEKEKQEASRHRKRTAEMERYATPEGRFVELFCSLCWSLFGVDKISLMRCDDTELGTLDRMLLEYTEQQRKKQRNRWLRQRVLASCIPIIGWFIMLIDFLVSCGDYYDVTFSSAFGFGSKSQEQEIRDGSRIPFAATTYPVIRKAVHIVQKADAPTALPLKFLYQYLRNNNGVVDNSVDSVD